MDMISLSLSLFRFLSLFPAHSQSSTDTYTYLTHTKLCYSTTVYDHVTQALHKHVCPQPPQPGETWLDVEDDHTQTNLHPLPKTNTTMYIPYKETEQGPVMSTAMVPVYASVSTLNLSMYIYTHRITVHSHTGTTHTHNMTNTNFINERLIRVDIVDLHSCPDDG